MQGHGATGIPNALVAVQGLQQPPIPCIVGAQMAVLAHRHHLLLLGAMHESDRRGRVLNKLGRG